MVTNDSQLFDNVKAQSNWGSGSDGQILGSNYRMTELQGALLRAQLSRLPEQVAQRDAAGRSLDAQLSAIPGLRPLPRAALGCDTNAYHLYLFRYDEATWELPRGAFLKAMNAEGIPVAPGYSTPLYDWPVFAQKRFGPWSASAEGYADPEVHRQRCPVMEIASHQEGCWIKQSALLASQDELDTIVEAARKVWESRSELR